LHSSRRATRLIQDWEALGLDVAITELDIPTVDGDTATHAQRYRDVVATCLASDACNEVTVWGLTDGFTWLDGLVGEGSAPLLFDEDYQPKPAYVAVAEALAAG
jgi:endo-1,4-beta-xylanase